MATYATYFHLAPSPMVHIGGPAYSAFEHPYTAFKLHTAAPRIPKPASKKQIASSVKPDVKPKPVPAPVSTPPRKVNSQETSLFFRLPAELRNQIYNELLCPDAVHLKDLARKEEDLHVRHYNQTSTSTSLHPAILSTCQRIHEEAQSLLYESHVFHAHPSLLTSLPHLTSPSKPVLYPSVTNQISRWQISLRLDTDPRFTFDQATAAFSGAEYLEIRVWQAQFEACDFAVLKLFAGVRGVAVARVGGSVDPELARWLEHVMMLPQVEHKPGEVCRCDGDGCPGFKGRSEAVCGRCYRKVEVEWLERDWDLWRFAPQ